MEQELESTYEDMQQVEDQIQIQRGDYTKLTASNLNVQVYQELQPNASKTGLVWEELKQNKKRVIIGGLILVFAVVITILVALTWHYHSAYQEISERYKALNATANTFTSQERIEVEKNCKQEWTIMPNCSLKQDCSTDCLLSPNKDNSTSEIRMRCEDSLDPSILRSQNLQSNPYIHTQLYYNGEHRDIHYCCTCKITGYPSAKVYGMRYECKLVVIRCSQPQKV